MAGSAVETAIEQAIPRLKAERNERRLPHRETPSEKPDPLELHRLSRRTKSVRLFESDQQYKKLRDAAAPAIEVEEKYDGLLEEFVRRAGRSYLLVENGTPLKGRCEMCPGIRIRGKGLPGGKNPSSRR
jgi:hypothetical protein